MDWIASILSRHPDGEALRDLSEMPVFGDSEDGGARWHVQVVRKDDLLQTGLKIIDRSEENDIDPEDSIEIHDDKNQNQDASLESSLEASIDDSVEEKVKKWSSEIARRLDWIYPMTQKLNMPFKLSVSDMKRASQTGLDGANIHIPALVPKPKFMEGQKKKSGADIGTSITLLCSILI